MQDLFRDGLDDILNSHGFTLLHFLSIHILRIKHADTRGEHGEIDSISVSQVINKPIQSHIWISDINAIPLTNISDHTLPKYVSTISYIPD